MRMTFRAVVGAFNRTRSMRLLVANLFDGKKPVPVKIDGVGLFVRPNTPDVGVAASCLRGEFDPAFEALGEPRYGLIIDAGGYIGTAAIAFAMRFPKATVITIEPDTKNFEILKCNVAGWPNIHPIKAALSNVAGKTELYDRGSGPWGLTIVANPADRAAAPMGQVDVVTVDDLLALVGAAGIDILKLDIEGGEARVLAGNPPWLERTSVIFAELHDRIVPGCIDLWLAATAGRANSKAEGEKVLSVRA